MRVLVIEDDPDVSGLVQAALARDGLVVDTVASAQEGLARARSQPYDAVVLDGALPDGDGLAVCASLRAERRWLPVLMLTARHTVEDRVRGLDAGADDYLTKPFAVQELRARVRALLRREARDVLTVGDLVLDVGAHAVTRGGRPVELTAREFALLRVFMSSPGQALTRAELHERVWDATGEGDSNVVDVYVRYLREKVDRPFGRADIETVRGVGYRLAASS